VLLNLCLIAAQLLFVAGKTLLRAMDKAIGCYQVNVHLDVSSESCVEVDWTSCCGLVVCPPHIALIANTLLVDISRPSFGGMSSSLSIEACVGLAAVTEALCWVQLSAARVRVLRAPDSDLSQVNFIMPCDIEASKYISRTEAASSPYSCNQAVSGTTAVVAYLEKVYSSCNPDKLTTIPRIMSTYKDNLTELVVNIWLKYHVPPPSGVFAPAERHQGAERRGSSFDLRRVFPSRTLCSSCVRYDPVDRAHQSARKSDGDASYGTAATPATAATLRSLGDVMSTISSHATAGVFVSPLTGHFVQIQVSCTAKHCAFQAYLNTLAHLALSC
jgi:hypothetical protein